ncbi:2-hydroxyacyl-CoA dehydratase [Rhodococcus wratislaviensis]|uniref:2-hydroxyacyl-CoA dehydratase n=1 Tax=Rhodococcus wratislaviensis TaxID=44752 RepID=UPI003519D699
MIDVEQLYNDRWAWARAQATKGSVVVLTVGADIPHEILHAAGVLPVDISSGYDPSASPVSLRSNKSGLSSANLLGAAVDPVAAVILDHLLREDLDFAAAVVVSSEREAWVRLFQVLRELARIGEKLPPIHLVDALHFPRAASRSYTREQFIRLRDIATGWTNTAPDQIDTAAAIAATAPVHTRLFTLRRARTAGRISGLTMLHSCAATRILPPKEAVTMLDAQLETASAAETDNRPGLYLWGSPPHSDRLFRIVESGDWRISGDEADDCAVTSAYDDAADSADDPIGFLVDAYCRRGPLPTSASPRSRAIDTLCAVRRSGARVLLGVIREHDEAPRWDAPALRTELDTAGIRSAFREHQPMEPDHAVLHSCLEELSVHPVGAGE